jgi:hypothetical protein
MERKIRKEMEKTQGVSKASDPIKRFKEIYLENQGPFSFSQHSNPSWMIGQSPDQGRSVHEQSCKF